MRRKKEESGEVLKGYGFRASQKKVVEATRLGIDIGKLIRDAIDYAISIRKESCVLCGSKMAKHSKRPFCDEN